jgi:hypothetical protein
MVAFSPTYQLLKCNREEIKESEMDYSLRDAIDASDDKS